MGFELSLRGLGSSELQVTEVLLFLWGLDLGSLGSQSPHGAAGTGMAGGCLGPCMLGTSSIWDFAFVFLGSGHPSPFVPLQQLDPKTRFLISPNPPNQKPDQKWLQRGFGIFGAAVGIWGSAEGIWGCY